MPELTKCRICGHVHDPEDGACDAHAHIGIGLCPCPGEGFLATYKALAHRRSELEWERDVLRSVVAHVAGLVVQDTDGYSRVHMNIIHRAREAMVDRTEASP